MREKSCDQIKNFDYRIILSNSRKHLSRCVRAEHLQDIVRKTNSFLQDCVSSTPNMRSFQWLIVFLNLHIFQRISPRLFKKIKFSGSLNVFTETGTVTLSLLTKVVLKQGRDEVCEYFVY